MKRLLFILLFAALNTFVASGQGEQRYLVFKFNNTFECMGYLHGTGDHLWIVPFDEAKDRHSKMHHLQIQS